MTLDQIQAMTNEEIRVRVAELCGWKNVHKFNKWKEGGPASLKDGDLVGDFNGRTRSHLPNYPADLNACREMAMTLSGFELRNYRQQLDMICGNDIEAPIAAIDATARQRCEAFIAVMTP